MREKNKHLISLVNAMLGTKNTYNMNVFVIQYIFQLLTLKGNPHINLQD